MITRTWTQTEKLQLAKLQQNLDMGNNSKALKQLGVIHCRNTHKINIRRTQGATVWQTMSTQAEIHKGEVNKIQVIKKKAGKEQ